MLWRASFAIHLYCVAHDPLSSALLTAIQPIGLTNLETLARRFFSRAHLGLFIALLRAMAKVPIERINLLKGGGPLKWIGERVRGAAGLGLEPLWRIVPDAPDPAEVIEIMTEAHIATLTRRATVWIVCACLIRTGRVRSLAPHDAPLTCWHSIRVEDALMVSPTGYLDINDPAFTPLILSMRNATDAKRVADEAAAIKAASVSDAAPSAAAASDSAAEPAGAHARMYTTAVAEGMRIGNSAVARNTVAVLSKLLQRDAEQDEADMKKMRGKEKVAFLRERVRILRYDNQRLNDQLAAKFVAPSRRQQAFGSCMVSCFLKLVRAVQSASSPHGPHAAWLVMMSDPRRTALREALGSENDAALVMTVRGHVLRSLELMAECGATAEQKEADRALLECVRARSLWDETDSASVLPELSNLFCVRIRWSQPHTSNVDVILPKWIAKREDAPLIEMALVPALWRESQVLARDAAQPV